MAITLTKKVTSTWTDGNPPQTGTGSISAIVGPFIADMVAQNKTDGEYYNETSYTISYRLWTDQPSAQAFADLIESAAAGLGRTDFSYVITDI
jgi:hypothetical protein